VQQFDSGHSNPTFFLSAEMSGGKREHFVLRKKPPGQLVASAHQVDREFRVISALAQTDVPVAPAHCLCTDDRVIGQMFYIMSCVEGRILIDPSMPDQTPVERAAIFDSMNDVLARIHNVDYRAVGLGDYGREGQYIQRQIARWSSQYDLARTHDIPAMERLKTWLPAHIPPGDETRINHGDYRLGNTIVHPTEPRIIAVLDWELATLGHPLSDLAYACMYYHLPAGEGRGGLADVNLRELGIPDENEFIATYCRHAGRARIDNWPFFLAFSCFRMAAITQGVYARGLQGNAADPRALTYGGIAKQFAATGLRLAGRNK
jgi:aminoglycoside phosphotransferase (APT) family kinase protein